MRGSPSAGEDCQIFDRRAMRASRMPVTYPANSRLWRRDINQPGFDRTFLLTTCGPSARSGDEAACTGPVGSRAISPSHVCANADRIWRLTCGG